VVLYYNIGMEAYHIMTQLLKDSRKLEFCMNVDAPDDLKELLDISCPDVLEDLFWNLKDYSAFDRL